MKVRTVLTTTIVVLLVALLGIGYWVLTTQKNDISTVVAGSEKPPIPPLPPEEEQSEVAFSTKMAEDFSYRLVSFPIGEQVFEMELIDHTGVKFNLHKYFGKKLLLYFDVEACESCFAYYSILEDWAQRYRNDLQIVMLFKHGIRGGFEADLVKAGIRLVPEAVEAMEKFDLRYTNNYLVDSSGIVQYYFDFDYLEWTKVDHTVDSFVRTGTLLEGVLNRGYLQKGESVPKIDLGFDIYDENELDSSKLLGKPSLIFMSDQISRFSEAAYPLMNSLYDKYKDKANIILLINGLRTNESYEIAAEFYKKYDLPLPGIYNNSFADNPFQQYIEEKGLKLPTYPALVSAMSRWGIMETPGVVVLDNKGVVKHYLVFESQRSEQNLLAEEFLSDELEKLLE